MFNKCKVALFKFMALPAWFIIAVSCSIIALVSCTTWLLCSGSKRFFGSIFSCADPFQGKARPGYLHQL